ncbi:hypothetical protein RJ639_000917 [Escallonia herrerae]|uniref:Peptidase S8/S53 domain-containing protein n=1 Tax=Escallonia herrerae TaxID=1293975 RepID=A0AA88XQH3_9ASTE|nr:hypothetical protein RJ639_000917 [Escallonia herrerae]
MDAGTGFTSQVYELLPCLTLSEQIMEDVQRSLLYDFLSIFHLSLRPSSLLCPCFILVFFVGSSKIVGARSYEKGDPKTIMSDDDHGTLCAALAAGNAIKVDGYGICRGSLPSARIAVYRVGSTAASLFKALMDAVHDKVDVISVSMFIKYRDQSFDEDFSRSDIGRGTYIAMMAGIPSCASAGNVSGWGTVHNSYPWIICCGASTSSRKYTTKIRLQNGTEIEGFSRNEFPDTKLHDLVFASACSWCLILLRHEVLCDPFPLPAVCFKEKESKMITAGMEDENFEFWFTVLIPDGECLGYFLDAINSVLLESESALKSEGFMQTLSRLDQCQILRSVVQEPTLASFSAQGPDSFAPCVLKPDICAPGVDIVAPTVMDGDGRVSCIVESGTSLATAIVAGAMGYLKRHHPDWWSPAALRSSLMTTDSVAFKREVTFVGSQLNMQFNAKLADISHPAVLHIEVDPKQLIFEQEKVKKSFRLTVTLYSWEGCEDDVISASLVWENESYSARSPIVIYKKELKATRAIEKAHVKFDSIDFLNDRLQFVAVRWRVAVRRPLCGIAVVRGDWRLEKQRASREWRAVSRENEKAGGEWPSSIRGCPVESGRASTAVRYYGGPWRLETGEAESQLRVESRQP